MLPSTQNHRHILLVLWSSCSLTPKHFLTSSQTFSNQFVVILISCLRIAPIPKWKRKEWKKVGAQNKDTLHSITINILHYSMLHYFTILHVTLHYVASRDVTSHHVKRRQVTSCQVQTTCTSCLLLRCQRYVILLTTSCQSVQNAAVTVQSLCYLTSYHDHITPVT